MRIVKPEGAAKVVRGPRCSWNAIIVAFAGMVLGHTSGLAQQVIVNPRWTSMQDKAPLAWREGDVFTLLNMGEGDREPGGDWAMQPMISTTWGRPIAGAPTGWATTRPDGIPLGKIYAFGGAGPTDGTNSVDWGDGSFLRVSATAAFKYNLPEGSILYSTRLNTSVLVDPKDRKRGTSGYGTRYRIMVFLSKDNAKSWSVLPPVAASGKKPADDRMQVGLWSNFLHERGDGTIQIYYDNELAAWHEPGGRSQGEQWIAMQALLPGPPLAWTGQRNEIIVDGHQPGRPKPRAGMASVSEKSPSDGTMILTVEDVSVYEEAGMPGRPGPRFQGVVRVLKSSDGGTHWMHVNTLRPPRGFNNLSPYHIRGKITGDLILVCRSDVGRMDDPANPAYEPYVAVKRAAESGNGRWILGNLHVYRSADDGITWQHLEQAPGLPYRPGGPEFSVDPGLAELKLSPTSSNLIFQWGQLLGGLDPTAPGSSSKTWVQTVTVRK